MSGAHAALLDECPREALDGEAHARGELVHVSIGDRIACGSRSATARLLSEGWERTPIQRCVDGLELLGLTRRCSECGGRGRIREQLSEERRPESLRCPGCNGAGYVAPPLGEA